MAIRELATRTGLPVNAQKSHNEARKTLGLLRDSINFEPTDVWRISTKITSVEGEPENALGSIILRLKPEQLGLGAGPVKLTPEMNRAMRAISLKWGVRYSLKKLRTNGELSVMKSDFKIPWSESLTGVATARKNNLVATHFSAKTEAVIGITNAINELVQHFRSL
ncbi:MAG: hypothetical protein WC607_04720 [Candidatus Micrarchaeia archaeon]